MSQDAQHGDLPDRTVVTPEVYRQLLASLDDPDVPNKPLQAASHRLRRLVRRRNPHKSDR
jgi:uncharacterized protein (DUF1778 family)